MLTVLQVAYPFAPVGRDAVGGAEQVLTTIDHALVRAGHRSIVLAQEGSRAAGQLLPMPRPSTPVDDRARRAVQAECARAIEQALSRERIDVVHLHGVDLACYLPQPGPAVLGTLHLPVESYPPELFALSRPRTWLNCVSAAQERTCPPSRVLVPRVDNGVDLGSLATRVRKRRFAIALGRVCPEKGLHLALDAARRAGLPLLIGGRVFPYREHQRYYDREIAPRLGRDARFLGPLALDRKRRLLGAARCLVIASVIHETSSLVAMEALACGTPVVALATPALEDIVEHGRTGWLVRDPRELAAAIQASSDLRPRVCRESSLRFSASTMTARYLALYERLTATAA